MRRFIQFGLAPLMLAIGLSAWTGSAAATDRTALPASTTYSEQGFARCTKCHDDEHTSAIMSGPHGVGGDSRTPASAKGCESCHGPGAEHAKQSKKFRVAETFEGHDPSLAASRNEVCMGCHGKSVQGAQNAQRHYLISEHSLADVSCVDCHSVHSREDKVKKRLTQAQVCVDCHQDQKANMNKYSRHPIREGKVVCTDCHNPHGSKGDHQLVEATTNEVCYKCHAEKRGPFMFEHEPVQDACTNCHNPHGTVNDNLLIARPPYLCQQCHNDTRHPGTNYANANIVSSTRGLGHACTDCHTNVHGSNHPSGITFRR